MLNAFGLTKKARQFDNYQETTKQQPNDPILLNSFINF